jgi:hypothetical protein
VEHDAAASKGAPEAHNLAYQFIENLSLFASRIIPFLRMTTTIDRVIVG